MTPIADILPTNSKSRAFLSRLPTVLNDQGATELGRAVARQALAEGKPLAVIADETGLRKPVIEGILFHGTCPTKRTVRVLAHWLGLTESEALGMFPGGWAPYRSQRGVGSGDLRSGWRGADYVTRAEVSELARERADSRTKKPPPPVHTGPRPIEWRRKQAIAAAVRQATTRHYARCVWCQKATALTSQRLREQRLHGWRVWHARCRREFQRDAYQSGDEARRDLAVMRAQPRSTGRPVSAESLQRGVVAWLQHHMGGKSFGELEAQGMTDARSVVHRAAKWIPPTWEELLPGCGPLLRGLLLRD